MDHMKRQVVLLHPGYFSLGLMSIGTYLESHGYEVTIVQQDAPFLAYEIRRALDQERCIAVGATAMTPNIASAVGACGIVKRLFPKMPMILGGNHVTALPEETLRQSEFDIGVVGEGEETALKVIRSLEHGSYPTKVPGTFEKLRDGSVVANGCRARISDLSTLPLPRYSLFDVAPSPVLRDASSSTIRGLIFMVSRGCPFSCAFCGSELIWRRKLRFFPVERVIPALESLIEAYQLDSVAFLDDELLSNTRYITRFCDELIRRGIDKKIAWDCQARVNSVTEEKIRMIKKAGCRVIRFGMESGSDKILGYLKKNTITVAQCYEAAAICRRNGLRAVSSFMIGTPDETLDDIMGTVDLIETSGIVNANIYSFVPYPGTDLYTVCKNEGLMREDSSWLSFFHERYRGENVPRFVVRNRHFSEKQLFHIARYVNNHVAARLNYGLSLKRGVHRDRLERIVAGEYGLSSPDLDVALRHHAANFRLGRLIVAGQKHRLQFLFSKLLSKSAGAVRSLVPPGE